MRVNTNIFTGGLLLILVLIISIVIPSASGGAICSICRHGSHTTENHPTAPVVQAPPAAWTGERVVDPPADADAPPATPHHGGTGSVGSRVIVGDKTPISGVQYTHQHRSSRR